MTTVDAVVVRWRSGPELDRCLDSLARTVVTSVTVVDSGSADGGAARLRNDHPKVGVIELDDNVGFAAAAETGIANGAADLVLLINPDTVVPPGTVSRLAADLADRPAAFGAVPLLVGPHGHSQHRWQLRHLPTPWRLATGRPGVAAFRRRPATPHPVQQPAAAAWLVRRSRWAALGGLDSAFRPAWWEDVDLCARLHRDTAGDEAAGFWVVPDATIHHLGGSSVPVLGQSLFLRTYYGNLLQYTDRHHPDEAPRIRRLLRLMLSLRAVAGRPALFRVVQALS